MGRMEIPGGLASRRQLLIGGVALAVLLLGLWVLSTGRYVFINAGDGVVYRADRWTGKMILIEDGLYYPVGPGPP